VIPVAVLTGIALVSLFGWRDRKAREELGRWRAIGQRLQADSARAAAAIQRVDSVFTRDTVRLTKTVTRLHTVVDSLRITDTLTVREAVIVSVADSVIRVCRETVTSCEARVSARDSLIRLLGEQRAADQRLAAARLRASNPRLLPYVEAGVDPLHHMTWTARGGAELRLFGPVRATVALQYSAAPLTTTTALVGARWTF
jgi:hypothetical protein